MPVSRVLKDSMLRDQYVLRLEDKTAWYLIRHDIDILFITEDAYAID